MIKKYDQCYAVMGGKEKSIKWKIHHEKFLPFFILIFNLKVGFAQETIVKGVVTDSINGSPLPFANIYFPETETGTTSDEVGNYELRTNEAVDSVVFATLGYNKLKVALHRGTLNVLNVSLSPQIFSFGEVTVKPEGSLAKPILEAIHKNKYRNDPEKYQRYSYQKYSRWEYRVNNIPKKFLDSKAFENYQNVIRFDTVDSAYYLPVYFSEQVTYNQFQRNPLKQKSTVLADKTSGLGFLNDHEVGGYTSALDIMFNFYDNYIKLYGISFVSPLASNGNFYYRYYVEDSTKTNSETVYRIGFRPKRPGENVFYGYFTTENKRYSVKTIHANLSAGAKLNFIKRLNIESDYQLIHDTIPFYGKNRIDALLDYYPGNDTTKARLKLYSSVTSSFRDVNIDPQQSFKLDTKGVSYETIRQEGALERDSAYWASIRHEKLQPEDISLYQTIDSINKIPVVKLADNLTTMAITGYYDFGKFELGPYLEMVNYNKVDGYRFLLGGRTSKEVSKRFMVWGGLGYATRTTSFFGNVGIGYKLPGNFRRVIMTSYNNSVQRIGENEAILYLYENALTPSEDNLISDFFRRHEVDQLMKQVKIKFTFENEIRPGYSIRFNLSTFTHYSPEFYPFVVNNEPIGYFSGYEFSIDNRFSWKEKIMDDQFQRLYLTTPYPIFHLAVGMGQYNLQNQNHEYARIHATVKQNVYLGQTLFRYALEAGGIFGKVPYTLLDIPRGNETYGYYTYDFNLLNYMEFVDDRYLHAYLEYHLNGFVFNRVPLLKKIGLREVFSAKAMVGSLSQTHQTVLDFPAGMQPLTRPYLEVGAGIENVLKFFRVEGIWRVTPSSVVSAPSFGVLTLFTVQF